MLVANCRNELLETRLTGEPEQEKKGVGEKGIWSQLKPGQPWSRAGKWKGAMEHISHPPPDSLLGKDSTPGVEKARQS